MRDAIAPAIESIKEELDEHLDSINANTAELQTNYEYLCELDNKIEKLNEKLEEIQLSLGLKKKDENALGKVNLTLREQEVFLVLYTSDEPLTFRIMAKRLGLTAYVIKDHVDALIIKGVPIIKRYSNDETLVLLDDAFKNLQAKENVLGINELVIKSFI